MAAALAISSLTAATAAAAAFPLQSSLSKQPFYAPSSPAKRVHRFKIHAELGSGDGEIQKGGKKKFITREQEPEQYWQTAGERDGENPMMTPIPYIIIFGMSTPFIILAVAFANGWIKMPIR